MSDLKSKVLDFLRANPIMSAAINGQSAPISTVLLFTISDDFVINFAVRTDSFKAQALKADPRMSISVWKMEEMMIQASGHTTQVTDTKKILNILDHLATSVSRLNTFWPPVLQLNDSDYQVFELKLTWVRMLDLTQNNILDNGHVFTDIIK